MLMPPPMWPLDRVISLPHTSGPRAHPQDDGCSVCERFDKAIAAAEAQGNHVAAVKYREGKATHLAERHQGAQQ